MNIFARLTQFSPVLDANGDLEDGINYTIVFLESQDTSTPIVSPRVLIFDQDIDPIITQVTITLTNPQLPSNMEYLSTNQMQAPAGLTIYENATEIVLSGSLPISDPAYITALLSILYHNAAEEPIAGERLILISVSDGIKENSPKAQVTIDIMTFDDVPIVNLNGIISVEYQEGSDAKQLAPALTIIDPDSANISSASVYIEEVFDEGNESISLNTTLLGDVSCSPASCEGNSLSLIGLTSKDTYQAILRSLQYVNLKKPADLPSLRDRRVFIKVNDGLNDSQPVSVLVDIVPINDRVIIELDTLNPNFYINYTEDSGAEVKVVGATRHVDVSVEQLERVVINIRDEELEQGEQLLVISGCSLNVISTEVNTVLKQITFSQKAPVDLYLDALDCIRYKNTEDEPLALLRYVDFLFVPGGGIPNDTAFTQVTILHINDNPPTCSLDIGEQTVLLPEDTNTSSVIHTLEAVDIDQGGSDGDVSYEFISGDTSKFGILANSGEVDIILIGEVDFEGVTQYPLVIRACDAGAIPLCCNFNFSFQVTDANDNAPEFEMAVYALSVDENLDTVLVNFSISDNDTGINAEIMLLEINSIMPLMGCMDLFAVETSPPMLLTTNGGLDFELEDECTVQVIAYDGGSPQQSAVTTVIVTAINLDDKKPTFVGSLQLSVLEDNTVPEEIGVISATDPDSNDTLLTFSLPSVPSSEFTISPSTGVVTIHFSTNFSIAQSHSFEVRVADPAGNSETANVTVQVLPVNNDPPILDLNNLTPEPDDSDQQVVFVEESGIPVTLLSRPFITDQDQVMLTISHIAASIAQDIDPSSEKLLVQASAPPHTTSILLGYDLVILPGNPTDLNEVYLLIQSIQYINTEDELSPCAGSLCISNSSRTILISVFDSQFESVPRATFVIFQAINDPPELDLDTTRVEAGEVNYVEGDPPTQIVNGDFYTLKDDDSVTLARVDCTLTNPLDGAEESLLVTGSVAAGISLSGNGTHMVSFTGNALVAEYRAALGLVQYFSTASNPNVTEARLIECYAFDGVNSSEAGLVLIKFQETNNIPRLLLGLTSVTYTEGGPAVLLTSSPMIIDEDDAFMQLLVVTVEGADDAQHVLSVNTSLIAEAGLTSTQNDCRINGTAPISVYEAIIATIAYADARQEFTSLTPAVVSFTVTDSSGNSSVPVNVTVALAPVDDNSPVFEQASYTFAVSELASNGSQVGTVTVNDADLPQPETPMFYIIVTTTENNATILMDFWIQNNLTDPLSGILYVNGLLDYDARATSYDFIVTAQSGPFMTSTNITINVINENDIAPYFISFPQVFYVYESTGSEALNPPSVTAVDPDGFSIQYSVISQYVAIDPENGTLSLKAAVDREGAPGTGFSIVVVASDGEDTVSQMANVIVLDVNEHAPEFSEDPYLTSIEENAPPSASTPLLTVNATDADEFPDLIELFGFMTDVTYEVQSSSFSGLFELDNITGELFQKAPLDYEIVGDWITLTVVAHDNSDPPLSSSVSVIINVTNINDEQPKFVDFPTVIYVNEGPAAGFDLVIIGEDSDPDSDLIFSLSSSVPSAPFQINPVSGRVLLLTALDADPAGSIRQYPLTITLNDTNTDSAYPASQLVTGTLTIVLEDINDNVPQFEKSSYSANISENTLFPSSGAGILSVVATDADYGSLSNGTSNGFNIITYSLSGAPAGLFAISGNTIFQLTSLDREQEEVYVFYVIAMDSPTIGIPNTKSVEVVITVTDINEHPPVADPDEYFAAVPEDFAFGPLSLEVGVQWSTQGEYPCTND